MESLIREASWGISTPALLVSNVVMIQGWIAEWEDVGVRDPSKEDLTGLDFSGDL